MELGCAECVCMRRDLPWAWSRVGLVLVLSWLPRSGQVHIHLKDPRYHFDSLGADLSGNNPASRLCGCLSSTYKVGFPHACLTSFMLVQQSQDDEVGCGPGCWTPHGIYASEGDMCSHEPLPASPRIKYDIYMQPRKVPEPGRAESTHKICAVSRCIHVYDAVRRAMPNRSGVSETPFNSSVHM